MALPYTPNPGAIVMCSFPQVGEKHVMRGEMVKTRPVVIISRSLPGRDKVVNVVPLSMTMNGQPQRFHVEVPVECFPAPLRQKDGARWAVCDKITTVSLDRLDYVKGPLVNRKRADLKAKVHMQTLMDIRLAVADVLAITRQLMGCPDAAVQATIEVAEVIGAARILGESEAT